ncbi:hypothetical protein [Mesorhizobium sp. M7A.F.Ca.CA.001.12.2.1]
MTESGTDIIEAVPMPAEIQQQLAAFVCRSDTHRLGC